MGYSPVSTGRMRPSAEARAVTITSNLERLNTMSHVPSLAEVLNARVQKAMTTAFHDAAGTGPLLRRSDRADWQANGILPLARTRKANPRELAITVADQLAPATNPDGAPDVLARVEVSGPGFLNIDVTDAAITRQLAARAADPRLGVPTWDRPGTTVIDYSQPNIAKEMHVGHLRSTVIGDAIVRLLEHAGQKVIRHNHLGDWGTQFGMLIQDLRERPDQLGHAADGATAMSRLNRLYRDARARFEAESDFAERARARVVALQAGDPDTLDAWREIVAESKVYFEAIYERLDVLLTDDDAIGESFYNDQLADVCTDLEDRGIAVRDDGALCVFFDDILGPDGTPTPLIIQKQDGGYGYATTDLAAIRYRVGTLGADQLLYVVDARQELHFRMVHATARRASWLPETVDAQHLAFGTVLGPDRKPFKTRAGETVRLIDLLDQAVDRARTVVADKSTHLAPDELDQRAREVGIGAVKYADLSTSRTRDYLFDLDRMVALNGNTGVYLQYAYARIQSLLRKATGHTPATHPELHLEPAERRLGLHLDDFGDALNRTLEHYEPHQLAAYLFDLAQTFTAFYESCPVLQADPAVRDNRLLICQLTRDTLHTGMQLLGIATPEQL